MTEENWGFDNPETPVTFEQTEEPQKNKDRHFYKEWFKSSKTSGFISLLPYLVDKDGTFVNKVGIEIGKVNPNTNKIESNTLCWVKATELSVYLDAVIYYPQLASQLYPKKRGLYSPNGMLSFGSSGNTSRVFKVEQWGSSATSEGTPGDYAWKCAHFEGKPTATGAVEPDYSKPLSVDMIKRTRLQMAHMLRHLNLELEGAYMIVAQKRLNG